MKSSEAGSPQTDIGIAREAPTPGVAVLQSRYKTSPEGLSQDEANRRLAQYGRNELPEDKRSPLLE
jgi:magnesium-transporting ATPase (P-type)